MTRIGIRQLRQNASAYLRLVLAGETVEIMKRGRPAALWIPLPGASGIARLEAEGRLSDAEGDLLELGPPLRPMMGAPQPSQVLARARAHER
jgi:antitoxin (DNA-binding transcriptional repressor) of toxin-antitoxin stability system